MRTCLSWNAALHTCRNTATRWYRARIVVGVSLQASNPLTVRLFALLLFGSILHAQTADRSATPPTAATNAPTAHSGTYSVVNGELIVAPGLRIPNGNVPWALDIIDGKQVLVPVHHSALTPSGTTAALQGTTSLTPLHATAPVFFIHTSDRTENNGDSGRGTPTGWALLPVRVEGGRRTVDRVKFTDVNAATVCAEPVICTQAEALPGGWLRMTPRESLQPGQYALLPVPKAATSLSPLAYDFVVSADAATAKDAVAPGQNLDAGPATKHHHKP